MWQMQPRASMLGVSGPWLSREFFKARLAVWPGLASLCTCPQQDPVLCLSQASGPQAAWMTMDAGANEAP